MQKLTVEELKRLLYDTFCDHLSMKDIENIIMTEENHIENPEDCQVDIDSKEKKIICLNSAAYHAFSFSETLLFFFSSKKVIFDELSLKSLFLSGVHMGCKCTCNPTLLWIDDLNKCNDLRGANYII